MKTLKLTLLSLLFPLITWAQADRASVPEVQMNQFMVASSVDFPAIQTFGVATCIAVVLYDSEMRLGAVAHISATTDIPTSMKRILDRFKYVGGNLKNIKVTLIGGWGKNVEPLSTSPIMLKAIKKFLAEQKIKIAFEETLFNEANMFSPKAIRSIEINLWDGRVYDYRESVPYIKRDRLDLSWQQKYNQKYILQPHPESL